MSQLRIAPIVEGHGEVIPIRTLLERIWSEIVGGEYVDVLKPVRRQRTKLLRQNVATNELQPDGDEIHRAVRLAALKLANADQPNVPLLILLMLDADEDCPKEIVESMESVLHDMDPRVDVATVFPKVEFETWFVAACASLTDFIDLMSGDEDIRDPERRRLGKNWIRQRCPQHRYSETVDQVRLTNAMDLRLCRENSPSFDKLCRELEKRVGAPEEK